MKSKVKVAIWLILVVLAVLWVWRLMWVVDNLKPLRNSAYAVREELELVDRARQEFAREKTQHSSGIVAFSNLVPYLRGDTNAFSTILHPLLDRNGLDRVGNPILIGTNEIAVGGSISDPIHVNPKTKEMLKQATHGDEFWGPYK